MIWEENAVKLSGLITDHELTFDTNVRTICKKASQKLTAILRLANILSDHKRKVLMGEGFILLTRGYGFMGGGCTTPLLTR